MKKAHFGRGLFSFLEELRGNNRRQRFEARLRLHLRATMEPLHP